MLSAESFRSSGRPFSHGGWIRVPLCGDPLGIVVLLPPERLKPEDWEQFLSVLEAMRPGLVDEPRRPVAQAEVNGG